MLTLPWYPTQRPFSKRSPRNQAFPQTGSKASAQAAQSNAPIIKRTSCPTGPKNDVGQGESTLIVCPNGNHILVDVGSSANGSVDDIRDYLLPVLDRSERRIHDLVITHPDRDHYNLVEDVLSGVAIDHIMYPGDVGDHSARNFDAFLDDFNRTTDMTPTNVDDANTPNTELACGEAKVFVLSGGKPAADSPGGETR